MSKVPTTPWWQEGEDFLAKAVKDSVDAITNIDGFDRMSEAERHLRVYGGRSFGGLGVSDYFRQSQTINAGPAGRLRWNVTKVVCDTVQARIAKNRPAPMFLTEGGNFGLQQQAKRLAQYVKGVFYTCEAYRKGADIFLDAATVGDGVMKIYRDDTTIHMERVFPWELHVDPLESIYGEPRNLFQIKFVDRQVLISQFPEHKDTINRATAEELGYVDGEIQTSDIIKVYEAWHLPSSALEEGQGCDGRHAIVLENATLFEEEYRRERFPFAFFPWCKRRLGFWSQGLVEELLPIQVEINRLLQSIQMNHHLGSHPVILKERGSKVEENHFNNQKFNIIDYTATPPQIVAFQTTHPEIYNHLETLYNRAYEIARLSRLSASGEIPAGISGSGRSMLVYNDIESAGFSIIAQAYEQFFMDAARHVIELSRQAFESGVDMVVTGTTERRRRRFLEKIKWSEVDMDDSAYEMKCMPVSSMPDRPEGKIAFIEQLSQILPMDPAQIAKLLDFPDVDSQLNMATATSDVIYEAIETMLEDGTYVSPEPFDNLEQAMQLVHMAYSRARVDGAPEDRLQLLRDYMQAVEALLPPPPPPPGMMPPGAPPAGPEAGMGGEPPPMPPEGMV